MNDLVLKNINMNYGDRIILKNVNLSASFGSIVTIFGPSGLGKTTLLQIISNLVVGYDGEVLFRNRRISKPIKNIVYLPQTYEMLLPWKSVLNNVSFVYRSARRCNKEIAIIESRKLLVSLKLGNALDMYPNQLSGGMKQRLALACVIASNADVLLLDEPFSSIDLETKIIIKQLILELKRSGKIILLVTHNFEDVIDLSDYIVIIDRESHTSKIIENDRNKSLFIMEADNIKETENGNNSSTTSKE